MKNLFVLLSIVLLPVVTVAQEPIKFGDVLDLEDRILLKEMTDKLKPSGPSANAPAPMPLPVVVKEPRVVYRTEALAVYGTSATYYEGQLSMNGRVYTVRTGTPVEDGYTVIAINPNGITLQRPARPSSARRKNSNPILAAAADTLFAPLVSR